MTLARWFRIHCAVTWPFAIPMVVVPKWFLDRLIGTPPDALSIDLSRVVGAAYILITMLTWAAPRKLTMRDQITLARVFCLYEALGMLVGLTIDFRSNGDLARWLTVGFFGVFALGYLWFGFLAPSARRAGFSVRRAGSLPRSR